MTKGKILGVPFCSGKNKTRCKRLDVELLERPLLFQENRAAFQKFFISAQRFTELKRQLSDFIF